MNLRVGLADHAAPPLQHVFNEFLDFQQIRIPRIAVCFGQPELAYS